LVDGELLNGKPRSLLRWLKIAERDRRTPSKAVYDKIEHSGVIQSAKAREIHSVLEEEYTTEELERLERMRGESGLWFGLACNGPELVDPEWDWDVVVRLMQEEKTLADRRENLGFGDAELSVWLDWHQRNCSLQSEEATELQTLIGGCGTGECRKEKLKRSERARYLGTLIALAAWARIGLVIENGLNLRGQRRGDIQTHPPLLDDLLAEKRDCAVGQFLIRTRQWLERELERTITRREFAVDVMPIRTAEGIRDDDNLVRRERAWRKGGETPPCSSIRALSCRLVAVHGFQPHIGEEVAWAGYLAVSIDNLRARAPVPHRPLIAEAVRRQRQTIDRWLP
jgi:hypothetical protein